MTIDPAETFATLLMDGERAHALCHNLGGRFTSEHYIDPVLLAERAAVLAAEGADVWLSAHPLKAIPVSGRGGADDVEGVSWLHADLDWRGEGHASEDLPTEDEVGIALTSFAYLIGPPTVTVHSGHGLQAWWELDEEVDPVEGAHLMLRLHEGLRRCGLKPERHDLASVLRLPGTINYKGVPVPVLILEQTGAVYSVADLDEGLPEVDAPSAPRDGAVRGEWREATLAVDAYNLHPDAADVIASLLAEAGWAEGRPDRAGVRYFTRPGKADGISATLGKVAPGVLYVFTSSAEGFDAEKSYDAADVLAIVHHKGDKVAADAFLHGKGWGASLYGAGLVTLGKADVTPRWDPSLFIPEEFWTARPIHEQVRQLARARRVGPDAVMGSLLTRVAAFSGHRTNLPAFIGVPIGLTLYVGLVGPPESGKSAAIALARRALPVPPNKDIPDGMPLGSGEGFVELLFTMVEDPDGGKVKVKQQTRHAAIFHIDEVGALTTLGSRKDSVVLSTLRTAFTHGGLGQANASAEKRRVVPGGSYVYGITMGIQPSEAGPLLADDGAGTPQRFLWLMANDPLAPEERPVDPPPLSWAPELLGVLLDVAQRAQPFASTGSEQILSVPDAIWQEVDADRLDALHGLTVRPLADAHTMLVRLKVAALLGILDGRAGVSMEDWHLASLVVRTSKAVRRSVESSLKRDEDERRKARNIRQAKDTVEVADVVAATSVEEAASSLLNHLRSMHTDGSSCGKATANVKAGKGARQAWKDDRSAVIDATRGAAYLDPEGHPRLT